MRWRLVGCSGCALVLHWVSGCSWFNLEVISEGFEISDTLFGPAACSHSITHSILSSQVFS